MRNPIVVSHKKIPFQVIWRKGAQGQNWAHYIAAETGEDAISEARKLMACDSVDYPEEIGNRRDWCVVEVRAMPDGVDAQYPRRRAAELM